jgi:hypothetical protein
VREPIPILEMTRATPRRGTGGTGAGGFFFIERVSSWFKGSANA